MPWAGTRVGPERLKGAYAWRSLLRSGAHLAGGSDFAVESENPLLGIYAAVTRQDLAGRPPGGWRKEEALTRAEALRLFTADNAWAEFAETRRGRIAPTYDADFTVLDRDIVSEKTPVGEIPKAKVRMTVVGGEIVYDRTNDPGNEEYIPALRHIHVGRTARSMPVPKGLPVWGKARSVVVPWPRLGTGSIRDSVFRTRCWAAVPRSGAWRSRSRSAATSTARFVICH